MRQLPFTELPLCEWEAGVIAPPVDYSPPSGNALQGSRWILCEPVPTVQEKTQRGWGEEVATLARSQKPGGVQAKASGKVGQ